MGPATGGSPADGIGPAAPVSFLIMPSVQMDLRTRASAPIRTYAPRAPGLLTPLGRPLPRVTRRPGSCRIMELQWMPSPQATLSLASYVVALGLAFVNQWCADALYVLVAVLWLIPDRWIERLVES